MLISPASKRRTVNTSLAPFNQSRVRGRASFGAPMLICTFPSALARSAASLIRERRAESLARPAACPRWSAVWCARPYVCVCLRYREVRPKRCARAGPIRPFAFIVPPGWASRRRRLVPSASSIRVLFRCAASRNAMCAPRRRDHLKSGLQRLAPGVIVKITLYASRSGPAPFICSCAKFIKV